MFLEGLVLVAIVTGVFFGVYAVEETKEKPKREAEVCMYSCECVPISKHTHQVRIGRSP